MNHEDIHQRVSWIKDLIVNKTAWNPKRYEFAWLVISRDVYVHEDIIK